MQKWNFPNEDYPLLSARLVARGSVDDSHTFPIDNEDLLSELAAEYKTDRDNTLTRLFGSKYSTRAVTCFLPPAI